MTPALKVAERFLTPALKAAEKLLIPALKVAEKLLMPAHKVAGKFIMLAMSAGFLEGCELLIVRDPSPTDSQLWMADRQSTIGQGVTPADSAADTAADPRSFQEAVKRLSTPELEKRKQKRREYQQRHYAEVLYELVLMDAPGALLASLRSQAQLELQLPNSALYVTIPIVQPPPSQTTLPGFYAPPSPHMQIPLLEDRRFPADPWSLK